MTNWKIFKEPIIPLVSIKVFSLLLLFPSSGLACGNASDNGEMPFKSFICRCWERIELQGMEFSFEGLSSPKITGEQFPVIITTLKNEQLCKFSKEVSAVESSSNCSILLI